MNLMSGSQARTRGESTMSNFRPSCRNSGGMPSLRQQSRRESRSGQAANGPTTPVSVSSRNTICCRSAANGHKIWQPTPTVQLWHKTPASFFSSGVSTLSALQQTVQPPHARSGTRCSSDVRAMTSATPAAALYGQGVSAVDFCFLPCFTELGRAKGNGLPALNRARRCLI